MIDKRKSVVEEGWINIKVIMNKLEKKIIDIHREVGSLNMKRLNREVKYDEEIRNTANLKKSYRKMMRSNIGIKEDKIWKESQNMELMKLDSMFVVIPVFI